LPSNAFFLLPPTIPLSLLILNFTPPARLQHSCHRLHLKSLTFSLSSSASVNQLFERSECTLQKRWIVSVWLKTVRLAVSSEEVCNYAKCNCWLTCLMAFPSYDFLRKTWKLSDNSCVKQLVSPLGKHLSTSMYRHKFTE
jgi:hypothetical protein